MAFYVGQKVVCIDDIFTYPTWLHVPNKPIKGHQYTIRGFSETFLQDRALAVWLEEIVNKPLQWQDEHGAEIIEAAFYIGRFRPITSRPTSISIFTAMLGPKAKERIDG